MYGAHRFEDDHPHRERLLPPPVPAPPVTIASTITAPSAIEQLDLRLIPPISAPYPVMSPYNFHFPPIFPYTTTLQFLTS
ncbi:unnamed protein product [Anisakis simplex]|uniref:Uncharacterized protein n=1 Tax=Anisakis simplex TaxID=6269 RepID=A0A0M3KH48_ANISI|nr:unnamed protein product [Anisakis simplex]